MDLFGTAGIRGPVSDDVTPELALAVGRAAARDARERGDPRPEFVIARDGRETGSALLAAVEAGLGSGGADVVHAGQLPTPALAFTSRGRYGIAVTASHNPAPDNGLKLFADGREYDGEAESRVEAIVANDPEPTTWDQWGSSRESDVLGPYRDAVADYAAGFGASPADLTVAVDCGNGVGGLATPQVLDRLGADVRALNANVDGHFPGRDSKPTAASLADLRAFVADGDADLGIAHDGDADRIVVTDGTGAIVHEDTVLAVLAERYVRESEVADPVVVTTPNASARIDDRVTAAGGRVERVHLGGLHEGIASVRAEGDDATAVVFAAEPWKHTHTGLGDWIDGVVSAAILTRLVAEDGIASLTDPIVERPYRKANVACDDDAKADAMAELEATLPETFPDATVSTAHGVRLEFADASWVLVRPSGTEPYVRVYAEADDVDDLVESVVEIVERAVENA